MKKSKILKTYDINTNISYKHQPLFVGDVYKNELGVYGLVISEQIDGETKYFYVKTNKIKHKLPEEKAGMNNSVFVANVVQDEKLMDMFIKHGIIEDDAQEVVDKKQDVVNNDIVVIIEDEEPAVITDTKDVNNTKDECKKATIVKEEKNIKGEKMFPVVEESNAEAKNKKSLKKETKTTLNIYQKINLIRKAWIETNVEKEGKGRAGGGAKYDYYKPQQIIDFCLAQELKNNLYSRFNTVGDSCYYELINLDNLEEKEMVMCPFEIPRKMAASEAQQVGAAMTYHNRRLAMMMYKIEDNSKESVDVLEKADYTKEVEIPTVPIIPAPPTVAEPPIQEVVNVSPSPVRQEVENVSIPPQETQNVITRPSFESVVEETFTKEEIAIPPMAKEVLPPIQQTQEVKTQSQTIEVTSAPKIGSIESLY